MLLSNKLCYLNPFAHISSPACTYLFAQLDRWTKAEHIPQGWKDRKDDEYLILSTGYAYAFSHVKYFCLLFPLALKFSGSEGALLLLCLFVFSNEKREFIWLIIFIYKS